MERRRGDGEFHQQPNVLLTNVFMPGDDSWHDIQDEHARPTNPDVQSVTLGVKDPCKPANVALQRFDGATRRHDSSGDAAGTVCVCVCVRVFDFGLWVVAVFLRTTGVQKAS